jgi:hypothetical protein
MTHFPYRDRLHTELVAAIGEFERRVKVRRKWLTVGLAAGSMAVALVGGLVYFTSSTGTDENSQSKAIASSHRASRGQGTGPLAELGAEHIGPATSLSEAEDAVPFRVLVPDTPDANSKNMTGSYVDSGSAVELDFPAPNEKSAGLRQPFISVWEAPWSEGDPEDRFKTDVEIAKENDITGFSLCDVKGLPAVCVEAQGSLDGVQQDNPAFVRFDLNGIEVHLYGGDSVQRLENMGESLVSASNSGASASGAPTR